MKTIKKLTFLAFIQIENRVRCLTRLFKENRPRTNFILFYKLQSPKELAAYLHGYPVTNII